VGWVDSARIESVTRFRLSGATKFSGAAARHVACNDATVYREMIVCFVTTHTQKPPRLPSTARAVALRLLRGLPRRAALERSPSLLATGRTAFIE
jgi:hypothetical protein